VGAATVLTGADIKNAQSYFQTLHVRTPRPACAPARDARWPTPCAAPVRMRQLHTSTVA
jgi:hypothetical protein